MQIQDVGSDFNLEHIVPYFQPVHDLEDGSVTHYECLARLITPQEQLFVPSQFLHIVEQQQCFGELARQIFHQSACYFEDKAVGWSMNIMASDITDKAFLDFLLEHIHQYPSPQRVWLELSAQDALNHRNVLQQFIAFCQGLKIGVMIDNMTCDCDWQSLLKIRGISGIKVSGQWINQPENTEQVNALSQLIEQARDLKLQLIAEHVEQAHSATYLKKLGIKLAQGYLFSHPTADAGH
ncbi:EAL domain-containing protein [Neptunicella marina]|uniref:EAL domain-containing protein n=2 Tax=Neptunicella marina TaxID=2125989 RepID=A0A8J6IUR6_9ALTE|nr:EAL domain-containing protein [Neptunicella marina]